MKTFADSLRMAGAMIPAWTFALLGLLLIFFAGAVTMDGSWWLALLAVPLGLLLPAMAVARIVDRA